MTKHLTGVYGAAAATPQAEPAKDNQVKNNAGGYVFQVDDFKYLDRFLILGTEGGTYYVGESKLTRDAAKAVERCIKADGIRTVKRIVEISEGGRAAKNDYALFALAMCASFGTPEVKQYALDNLYKVARIGTHLFHFVEYLKGMRGFGRSVRRAIAEWYTKKKVDKLAYQLVKYQSRDGWSNDDLLRKAHPDTSGNKELHELMQYVTEGWAGVSEGHAMVNRVVNTDELRKTKGRGTPKKIETYDLKIPASLKILEGFELAKAAGNNPAKVAQLIAEYGLTREMVPTEVLTSPKVWEALLENMPYTAMIRNLGNMSKYGLIKPNSDATIKIVEKLGDSENLRKARVHPIQILAALKTYEQGRGVRGKGEWEVTQAIVDALDESFYASFDFVPPTKKRYLIGQDISGSMTLGAVGGVPGLTPALASAALAMVTVRVEPFLFYGGFGTHFGQLKINKKMRLDEVLREISNKNFGGTDCAQPMIYAENCKMPVDVFCVYTDNETWAGHKHPFQALKSYRSKMGIDAKLVVIGMTSTKFTIADPSDPGMLDVVGFSTDTPAVISDFVTDGQLAKTEGSED